ncbi:MAG: hypothetical protein KGH59_03730 [Candidatus Micrarchaeota archaeon]|nr:hypothetical protein [Candidatus Micrarchaeota archaeon]
MDQKIGTTKVVPREDLRPLFVSERRSVDRFAELISGLKDKVMASEIENPDQICKRLEALWNYDLSNLTRKLISRDDPPQIKTEQLYTLEEFFGRMSQKQAEKIEVEFRKFASILLLEPKFNIGPSRPVDMYWHLLVLHTQEYRKFCDTVFGRFIDHVPGSDDTRDHSRKAYNRAVQTYRKLFGDPDESVWGALKIGEDDNCGVGSNAGCKGWTCGEGM